MAGAEAATELSPADDKSFVVAPDQPLAIEWIGVWVRPEWAFVTEVEPG